MRGIALILAAGKGTRMRSEKIKILHPLLGKKMVCWSIDAAEQAGLKPWIVVGHQEDAVRTSLSDRNLEYVRQDIPRGTGDAVSCAMRNLPETGTLLVMCGDTPLFRSETLSMLLDSHKDNFATVLSTHIDEPGSYGRLVRDAKGNPLKIVEASEASEEELRITEINTGAYVFDIHWLRNQLPTFKEHPPKNEIYLTDAIERAAQLGKAQAVILDDWKESQGVNDRWALAMAATALQDRIIRHWAEQGVGFEDPSSVTVESEVQLAQDVYLERGAILRGKTSIKKGTNVGAYSIISDCQIGENVQVKSHCCFENARIENESMIGPFARLREGTVIGRKAKIGNFVETKKAHFSEGAKASHLSYVGDAEVGEKANIGAGTITCNYDGFRKHKTKIGKEAFIGSNTALVAPVNIGNGAIVGAGSTITENVADNAIAVARGPLKTRADAAKRFRTKRSGDA